MPAISACCRSSCRRARSGVWSSCFSDMAGWTADLDHATERLGELGAVVLEVDLPAYLERLRHNGDGDCHYLISVGRGREQGRSSDSSASSATARRCWPAPAWARPSPMPPSPKPLPRPSPAPPATACPSASTSARLSARAPRRPPSAHGFSYGPERDLPGWWRVAATPQEQAAAEGFDERHRAGRGRRGAA